MFFFSGVGLYMWVPHFVNMILLERYKNAVACETINSQRHIVNADNITEFVRGCNDIIDNRTFLLTLIMTFFLLVLFGVMGFIINLIGKKRLLGKP